MKPFWDDSNYYTVPLEVTDEIIERAETKLGFKLPQFYLTLVRIKNGGTPIHTCFPTSTPNSWADNHIAIDSIRGIGGENGIDSSSERDNDEEWGYPIHIGIVICDCPSAGHDAVMLDYSICGKQGEPRVIHVDVETGAEPHITILANDFETFVNGFVHSDFFDEE